MDRAKATFQEVISVEMDVQIFGRNAAEFLCVFVCVCVPEFFLFPTFAGNIYNIYIIHYSYIQ